MKETNKHYSIWKNSSWNIKIPKKSSSVQKLSLGIFFIQIWLTQLILEKQGSHGPIMSFSCYICFQSMKLIAFKYVQLLIKIVTCLVPEEAEQMLESSGYV